MKRAFLQKTLFSNDRQLAAVGVVWAARRILTAITHIGIGKTVGVRKVGIQVTAILALVTVKLWVVAVVVAEGLVECVRRLWRCLGQEGLGVQVAQIGLGRGVGGKGDGQDSYGDEKIVHQGSVGLLLLISIETNLILKHKNRLKNE
jgi:hypothetical protein